MQTPPYGFFFRMKRKIKALPQGKSKELSFIPQPYMQGQQSKRE
jgi:hypothetical protein